MQGLHDMLSDWVKKLNPSDVEDVHPKEMWITREKFNLYVGEQISPSSFMGIPNHIHDSFMSPQGMQPVHLNNQPNPFHNSFNGLNPRPMIYQQQQHQQQQAIQNLEFRMNFVEPPKDLLHQRDQNDNTGSTCTKSNRRARLSPETRTDRQERAEDSPQNGGKDKLHAIFRKTIHKTKNCNPQMKAVSSRGKDIDNSQLNAISSSIKKLEIDLNYNMSAMEMNNDMGVADIGQKEISKEIKQPVYCERYGFDEENDDVKEVPPPLKQAKENRDPKENSLQGLESIQLVAEQKLPRFDELDNFDRLLNMIERPNTKIILEDFVKKDITASREDPHKNFHEERNKMIVEEKEEDVNSVIELEENNTLSAGDGITIREMNQA